MITIKLNLKQLKHSITKMQSQSGVVDCLIIPIGLNHLFQGDKGIYLDMVAFEVKEKKESKDTHLLKQSFSKEEREAMTDDQIKAIPILGNMRIWDAVENNAIDLTPVNDPVAEFEEPSDLPF